MFTLVLKTKNGAFREDARRVEVAHILASVADRVREGQISGTCRDTNGQIVGNWALSESAKRGSRA